MRTAMEGEGQASLQRSVSSPAKTQQACSTMITHPPPTSNRQISTVSTTHRMKSVGRMIKSNTANFFGIGEEQPCNNTHWATRRDRLLSKKYGRLKDQFQPGFDEPDGSRSAPITTDNVSPLQRLQSSTGSVGSAYRRNRTFSRRKSRKDSALRVTYESLSTMMSKRTQPPLKTMSSRTYAPVSYSTPNDFFVEATIDRKYGRMVSSLEEDLSDEVFFDLLTPTSAPPEPQVFEIPETTDLVETAPIGRGWRRKPPQPLPSVTAAVDEVDGRITDDVMEKIVYNSDRRQYGRRVVGRLINTTFKRVDSTVDKELDEITNANFRPYFTYWITFVQIVIYIVSVSVYGIAPVGFSQTMLKAEILTPRLAIEQLSRIEKDNLWIGPRAEDLIHLGAKYSPCMRKDGNIFKLIEAQRADEAKNSGCCVRNDNAGCYQTVKSNCSSTLSTFLQWGTGQQPPRAVCGQDPNYCTNPSSMPPFLWAADITKWPICRNTTKSDVKTDMDRHMSCEVVGHPCCTGIRGECIVTTREHCDFLRGYFHEDAFLCSHVNCMHEICGMIPFGDPNGPDQFYRLIASLFLHAGLLHLLFTILFQLFVMRDLEKMIGPIRMGFIYFGSGVAGNLSSAIFLPYLAEAGPSGCQFGILACLVAEYVLNWKRIERPWIGFLKLGGILILLFLLGLLPWIDNYAHLVGFCFGLLLAFIFLPYLSFGHHTKTKRIITLIACSALVIGLFVVLILLFYVVPIYDCPNCQFFTCIPITPTFCQNMAVEIRHVTEYT